MFCTHHLFVASCIVANIFCRDTVNTTDVPVLRAVRGRDAHLPCGQGKVFLDGPNSYVVWFKNEREFLYRFPNEEIQREPMRSDRVFGVRCNAGVCHDETALHLKRVSEYDAGTYRCRIHYQSSSTTDYVVNVTVVDTPGTPRIFNEAGEQIKNGSLGPYSLGSNLSLTCEVEDDKPETAVAWRRNGRVVAAGRAVRPGLQRAHVHVNGATRADVDARFVCSAQNADVTDPLVASVVFKMFLPPLSVEIRLNNNLDFEAGQPRVVDCVVVGCVPPPTVTWRLGDLELRSTAHKELHDGNYTVSSLTLAPALRDSKRELVCRVHNAHLPEVFEDRVTLNVGYRPSCVAPRDEIIGAVEKDLETVTCVVDSSPGPTQFSWFFADSLILHTGVKRVPNHETRYSSTLTWVPREEDIGLLLCRATNQFGEQKRPCTFTVAPGGPPNTPDCFVMRSYSNSLKVQCKKGWDGGRPQTVQLELMDMEGTLLHNFSDPSGRFNLPDFERELNLTAVVYARSIRGRSSKRTIYLTTLKPLVASAVAKTASAPLWARWLEVTVGILAVALVAAAIGFCVRAVRARQGNSELNPDLVTKIDGSFHREPDFTREERVLGTTSITVNQLATCQNQCTLSPVPSCRVLVDYSSQQESQPSTPLSYYV